MKTKKIMRQAIQDMKDCEDFLDSKCDGRSINVELLEDSCIDLDEIDW